MALARDNGYRLVVVIAGTKNNLMKQTVDRLDDDLLAGDGGANPWRTLENPGDSEAPEILDLLAEQPAAETVVCFVLKHHQRIDHLADAFAIVAGGVDLAAIPALIIDDEADQASLNLKARRGQESTTYSAIQRLRDVLPRHDFLMYTATPQGPLLIAINDRLSPQTVTVLRSGDGYVGGHELFVEQASSYVKSIPDAEVQIAIDPDSIDPPPTFRSAIATFLLALVIAQERRNPQPLAMLIHPDVRRAVHDRHLQWARTIMQDLRQRLADPEDAAFADVVRDVFQAPYADLAQTVAGLDPLDRLVRRLPDWARGVKIQLVNQNAQREIDQRDWRRHPGWIVIGGNKLDRGFTVKNLAITYMPRGPGLSNADTLQQRGRFFGYKAQYLDICRGWFNADTHSGFAEYVTHELALRRSLVDVESQAQPLRLWRRQLLLSPSLRPTRKQVINLPTATRRVLGPDGWFDQRFVFVHASVNRNREIAPGLFAWREQARAAAGDPRTTPHFVADVPVVDLLPLLADWKSDEEDIDRLLGVSVMLTSWLEAELKSECDVPPTCQLLFADGIDGVDDQHRARRRTPRDANVAAGEREVNVFQGAGSSGNGFPGDRAFADDVRPTVAVFLLDVSRSDSSFAGILVPTLAVHIPSTAQDLIVQT